MIKYIWQPQYVELFQCKGDECSAKCCKYWRIEIDTASLKKYKKLKDKNHRNKIISSIVYENGKYVVKHDDKGACPLICDNNMCYIQKNMGEEYLSQTCKIYPRHLIVLDGIPMHLLSMSCPIALKEAIFNPNGMILKRSDIKNVSKAWKAEYECNRDNFKVRVESKVEECVVIGSVCILQNKIYSWDERLILLCLFLDKAEEIISSKNKDMNLSDLVEIYLSEEFCKEAEKFFITYTYDYDGIKIIHELFSLPEAIIAGDVSSIRESIEQCNIGYDNLHDKAFNEWGYAIENYFIQEFLFGKYPFKFENGFMHNYFTFLLQYKEFEYNLYKIILEKGTICKDSLLSLIEIFTKLSDHGENITKTIEKFSLKYDNDPLNFMQKIIRYKKDI